MHAYNAEASAGLLGRKKETTDRGWRGEGECKEEPVEIAREGVIYAFN